MLQMKLLKTLVGMYKSLLKHYKIHGALIEKRFNLEGNSFHPSRAIKMV